MHHADKLSQHSSTIWPVWLNGMMLVYKLSDCGFLISLQSLNSQISCLFSARILWNCQTKSINAGFFFSFFSFLQCLANSEEKYSNTSRKWQTRGSNNTVSQILFLWKYFLSENKVFPIIILGLRPCTRTWYSIGNTKVQRSSGKGCICFVTEIYTILLQKCSFYKGFFQ